MFPDLPHICFDELQSSFLKERAISLFVARLDKIHPEVSGNKLFKLWYFIEACVASSHKTLLTFGGAFSNHLAATAFLCKEKNIRSIGVVRGEEPAVLSPTLRRCRELGMQLHFVPRAAYSNMAEAKNIDLLKKKHGHFTLIPEGGYSKEGAAGAALITDHFSNEIFSHICTATGTATTLAGLLRNKKERQEIISVPVIKNMTDIGDRLNFLGVDKKNSPKIFDAYHFGGYAKYTAELIGFMNELYDSFGIATDFVYTAKMMFAVTDQIKKGYFKPGSRVLCLHTGGLQGNRSLAPGTFIFE